MLVISSATEYNDRSTEKKKIFLQPPQKKRKKIERTTTTTGRVLLKGQSRSAPMSETIRAKIGFAGFTDRWAPTRIWNYTIRKRREGKHGVRDEKNMEDWNCIKILASGRFAAQWFSGLSTGRENFCKYKNGELVVAKLKCWSLEICMNIDYSSRLFGSTIFLNLK